MVINYFQCFKEIKNSILTKNKNISFKMIENNLVQNKKSEVGVQTNLSTNNRLYDFKQCIDHCIISFLKFCFVNNIFLGIYFFIDLFHFWNVNLNSIHIKRRHYK